MDKFPSLSIFFPFWNEEKNVEKVLSQAIAIAPSIANKWEILAIDDGSTDATLKIAKAIAAKNKNVKVISHKPNRGYGAALKEGFSHAQYDYVVFADGDGQFDFSDITKFTGKIKRADIVIGFRKKRHDQPFRHVLMILLKIWDLLFFGFYYNDIDCGFKLFRKPAIDKLMPLISEGAMITTEILAKAKKKKLTISQVEVAHYPRKFGNQSGGNIRVVMRAILETFTIKKQL